MKRTHPNLCKPLKVAGVTLRNRMLAAPTGATDFDEYGTPGPRTQAFYEAKAAGGAAVVTVSELVVHPETDGSQMLHLSLATPGQLGAFTFVADAISRHGAIPSIELSHSGQYAGTYMVDKKKKGEIHQFGPSDGVRPDGIPVKALTKEQIDSIVEAYAESARLSVRAGFQMVMVHCGHGWLINQFLSPYFNKRTDEYGGSLENRCRFAREVLEAVREAVGPMVPIEMRMSGSELFDGGYGIDEGIEIAKMLEGLVDIIHVSAGSYQFGFSITHPSMFRDHGVNVYLAEEIKKHVSKPVATIGGLSDPDQMEEIIASGKADLVAMARGLLADPEMPNKVMANRADEVVRCLRCFVCMAERPVTQTRRCTVNPRLGRENEGLRTLSLAERDQKKVLVVGGGIAGMVAAYTAAQRGHDVTLCEAEGELGGILRTEQAVDFKSDMYKLGITYTTLCERAGVDIRLNTKVDKAWADEFGADAVIIAVGSEPIKPPIPTTEDIPMYWIEDVYLDGKEVGEEVAIIGGGLSGCEAALKFSSEGKKAHLIEMRDELAAEANIRHRPILLTEIENSDVSTHLNTSAKEITGDGVIVTTDECETLVPADSVIIAVGQRPRTEVVDELRDSAPFVRVVGDAVRASNITNAVYTAFHAAMDI